MKAPKGFAIALLLVIVALAFIGWGGRNPTAPVDTAPATQDVDTGGSGLVITRELAAQEALNAVVLSRPGVNGTAIGIGEDGQAALVVLVSKDAARTALPTGMEGVQVRSMTAGPFTAFATCAGTSTSNDKECASGTLGALLTRNGSGGIIYWLSNNHVFARQNSAALGERIDAPGRLDAGCGRPTACGTLWGFAPIRFDGSNNSYDAAIALVAPGSTWSPLQAAGTNSYRPTNTIVQPAVGLAVKKVGRTTGFTTGTINLVNATVTVGYSGGRSAKFVGQMLTSNGFCQPGDSGSLVSTRSGGNPVGLLFAGDGNGLAVVSPIGPVLAKFNMRFQ
jgi:hypothetical protein